MQEYERYHQLYREEDCCDENTPCVPNNSNNNDKLLTNNTLSVGFNEYQVKYQDNVDYLHRGKNCHSKNIEKEELEKSYKEQQILLKQNKQYIIDFILDNKDSIRIEDLRIYEPVYKCYRKKGNCQICNRLSNILCISYSNYNNKIWFCKNHWKQQCKRYFEQQIR